MESYTTRAQVVSAPMRLRTLIVEDCEPDLDLLLMRLNREGFALEWKAVDSESDYLAALHNEFDLILSDWDLPQFSGLRALQILRSRGLGTPFIIVSGHIGEDAAIEAVREGADDYIFKDKPQRLGQSIRSCLEKKRLREEGERSESALRLSEKRYHSIFRDSLAIQLLLDAEDGRILDANDAAVAFYGYPVSRLTSMRVDDINILPREGITAEREKTRRHHQYFFNFRHRLASGEIRDVEVYSSPVMAGDRTILHSIIHDITERKRAGDILQASLRMHSMRIHEMSKDGSFDLQKQYSGISHRGSTERIIPDDKLESLIRCGVDEAEALTRSQIAFLSTVAPDQSVLTMQVWSTNALVLTATSSAGRHHNLDEDPNWAACIREQKTIIVNHYPRNPYYEGIVPGHLRIERSMAAPILKDGHVVAIMVVGNSQEDYYERDARTLEQFASLVWDILSVEMKDLAVRHSEALLRSVLEATPEIVLSLNSDLEIEFINRVAKGADIEKVIGDDALAWVDPAYIGAAHTAVSTAFQTGVPVSCRVLARGDYGQSRWFDISLVPIVRGDRITSVIASATDISEQLELTGRLLKTTGELQEAYDDTLQGWARALELREQETAGHSHRVVELTSKLAKVMGIPLDAMRDIERGALLHDIGKMGIPDSILLKPGPLDEDEWNTMRRHPELARDLLIQIRHLGEAIDIPLYHHEKWDGSGYPSGLSGERIPLAARIFAIVDVWDALIHDRPYRKALTEAEALRCITEESGGHFDPAVVEAFLTLMGAVPTREDPDSLDA